MTDLLDELREREVRLLQPQVRKSANTIAALLADEFIEFGSSGRVFNKQQIIESLLHEPVNPNIERSLTMFNASVLAVDVVLVTYQVVRYDSSNNQTSRSLRSSIWKAIDGDWKIVFHQGTAIAPSH